MVACSHHLFLRILPLHPPSSYFLFSFGPPLSSLLLCFELCFLLVSRISRLQISSSFLGDSFEVACRICVELLVLSDLCSNKLCAKMLWLYPHCIWLLIVDRRLLLFGGVSLQAFFDDGIHGCGISVDGRRWGVIEFCQNLGVLCNASFGGIIRVPRVVLTLARLPESNRTAPIIVAVLTVLCHLRSELSCQRIVGVSLL